jgi:hypothetical protein
VTTGTRRFDGSLEQLGAAVSMTNFGGRWERIPYGWSFRCHSGALLNWWPTTGAVTFQGKADRAAEFEAALFAVCSAPSAPPNAKLAPPGQS